MCGLLGAAGSAMAIDSQRVASASKMLSHRGPDACGAHHSELREGHVELRHTRLAVIDLSHGADQPLRSHDGRYLIVYNGEIYNYLELRQELKGLGHHFDTDSDTEVLLAAWAEWEQQALPRLRGMFAFAVVDCVKETLFLARDPFGIKPLYYRNLEGAIYFASEIPALLRAVGGGTFNDDAVARYLCFGEYDVGEATFIDEIRSLRAGHYVRVELKADGVELDARRWWYPSVESDLDVTFEAAADRIRELFLESVRIHLRSDVPLAFALSGGIDSSAVVCAAKLVEPNLAIDTYTFANEHEPLNEERYAQRVATHVGGRSTTITPNGSELLADLDRLIRAQGEPFGSASIYAQFRVFESAAEHGVTVLLEGQGADEIFAGYQGFPAARLRSMLDRREWLKALRFLRATDSWPDRSAARTTAVALSTLLPGHAERWALAWKPTAPPAWLSRPRPRPRRARLAGEVADEGRRLSGELRRQLVGTGALGSLLRHADRNSMHFSLESRVPFLNVDIAEFALRLPEEFLVSPDGTTKSVFRAAMRGIVPDEILDRRDKIGFTAPDASWLRSILADRSLRAQVTECRLLNGPRVRADLERWLTSGDTASGAQWWRILNLVRWEQYMSQLNVVTR